MNEESHVHCQLLKKVMVEILKFPSVAKSCLVRAKTERSEGEKVKLCSSSRYYNAVKFSFLFLPSHFTPEQAINIKTNYIRVLAIRCQQRRHTKKQIRCILMTE
ncbi:hypothetical protein L6164_003758 [Bauhinia variegata]|uniref:Uncharacterized protein n=1 Tax=Bauhinia variegata TaxID=167791 RepID=A0ACB9Q2A6_BAUVA|nr:hypothetical protein L6164_003758 [Bauhinia variegata]